ncbi:GYF domain-containing protein [Paenibacillus elgii]|uniref:GYF domain-containing protein n=1 Tax=Paenibacillus elgii TaxID=189691 RepID=UPI000FDC1B87|nr:GYF domain-containing protein [Paenibacillus elgii]NEN85285.1 DUF4339 domain-containing protein [Paenibacillus elgii]
MKRTWYYQATVAEGPFSQTEMEHLIANGIIDGYTNVRATTGGPWMPAKDTNAFLRLFIRPFMRLLMPCPAKDDGSISSASASFFMQSALLLTY